MELQSDRSALKPTTRTWREWRGVASGAKAEGEEAYCVLPTTGLNSISHGVNKVPKKSGRTSSGSPSVRGEIRAQCGFVGHAFVSAHHFAITEDQQERDRRYLELGGQLRIGLGVHLAHLEVACECMQNRIHRPAGAAPWRPEVHQHRSRIVQHFTLEVVLFE